MARFLLVSFAGYPYTPSSLMPDNGLASLAGSLGAAGHDVRILDYGTLTTLARLFPERLGRRVRPLAQKLFLEGKKLSLFEKARFLKAGMELEAHRSRAIAGIAAEVAEKAAEFGADFVGLKLWNGDGFSGSVKIAEAVRRRLPDVPVIGGGPQVDYFGRHILDYTAAFDVLVAGEGERVLPELVGAMSRGADWRGVSGIIWREGNSIRRNAPQSLDCLETLPLPTYEEDVYPALRGQEKIRIGVVDESRGCPNRCAFCIHPVKSGGKWNVKTPAHVLDEMRILMNDARTHYFIYSGSNTTARTAVGIAEEIIRQGLDVRYGCFGHVHGIAKADFDLLRRSGCEAIFYGLESGSPRILRDAFNKPLDLDEAERVISQTKEAGIRAIASVIFPAPFEDADSRAQTLSFLGRVRPNSVPVTIPGMIPGTPWERNPQAFGFEKATRKDFWKYALTYKIKLLFPPSMWKPLPYTLNGKSSKQLFQECEQFIAEIEAGGIVTDVPHEMVLMAKALGQDHDLRGFRDRCRVWFLSGDVEGVAEMAAGINTSVAPKMRRAAVHVPH